MEFADEKTLNFDLTTTNPSKLLTAASNGCCVGICYYNADAFAAPGIHEDQEGFYVLEGAGEVALDGRVYPLEPGMAFILAPGVQHSFRRNAGVSYIKVLWFHAAK